VPEIQLWNGDICDLEVDAIVNAATTNLWMSTGVGGAIKRRGGDAIEYEAVRQGPVPVGTAVVTGPGSLACRYVIHAVSLGPDRRTSGPSIDAAVRAALAAADRLGCTSIAIPALGTGVGGYPLDSAAQTVVSAVEAALRDTHTLQLVIFALRGADAYNAFSRVLSGAGSTQPAPAVGTAS
jgi:O-acetyl-ADP-ribose deacetylase (regulator of RNase III)